MILTLTLNPSIDYLYTKESFEIGKQNRFSTPVRMVGGKGINAGRTAAILGSDVLVTGILGGANGQLVGDLLKNECFSQQFFAIQGETRNAITIMHDQGIQTELVEEGPLLDAQTESDIFNYIITMCRQHPEISVICLSGSVNTLNQTLYRDWIKRITELFQGRIKVLADISGIQLKNLLSSSTRPFFIKPNLSEFSELLGLKVNSKKDVYPQLNHPLIKDVPLVLVSCGEEGAVAKFYDTVYYLDVPEITLVNPTGSGDATVGGIAYGLDHDFPIEKTLQYGMVSGVANALEEAVGFIRTETISAMLNQIKLKIS